MQYNKRDKTIEYIMEQFFGEYARENALINENSIIKLIPGIGAILICISSASLVELFSGLFHLFLNRESIPLFSENIADVPQNIIPDSAYFALMVIARTFAGMCFLYFIALQIPINGVLVFDEGNGNRAAGSIFGDGTP